MVKAAWKPALYACTLGCGVLAGEPPAGIAPSLRLLPENPRYFEYKGLPMVMYWTTHWPNWQDIELFHEGHIIDKSSYANFTTMGISKFRGSSYPEYWKRIHDDAYWKLFADYIGKANEYDLIHQVYFYEAYHSLEKGRRWVWLAKEFIADPDSAKFNEDLGRYGLPGVTRRDIHKKVIGQAAKHLGGLPNVVFSSSFEYWGVFGHGHDEDFAFLHWWHKELRQAIAKLHPEARHLSTEMHGGGGGHGDPSFPLGYFSTVPVHPSRMGLDFLLGEHNEQGFSSEPGAVPAEVWAFHVPLVRQMTWAPRKASCEDYPKVTDIGSPAHERMIEQIVWGMHTSEGSRCRNTSRLREWALRARWYMENIRTWANEPEMRGGDEITAAKLPVWKASRRPRLENPAGFENGALAGGNSLRFGAIYKDPEGEAPALAEVWIDRNRDGRFDPDPKRGERLTMAATGTAYAEGARFQRVLESPELRRMGPLPYVFRFADAAWNPPEAGGLIPGKSPGISYSSWTYAFPVPTATGYLGLAEEARTSRDLEAAVLHATRAIALDPGSWRAYHLRGMARSESRDFTAALDDFGAAARLNPRHADSHYRRGLMNVWRKRFAAAHEDFETVIRIDPDHLPAYMYRTRMRAVLGMDDARVCEGLDRMEELTRKLKEPYGGMDRQYLMKTCKGIAVRPDAL